MSTLVNYKGLQVVSPDPTGAGGNAIQFDLKHLVDWHPQSVWSRTADPTGSDDQAHDFYPGSLWLRTDTTPPKLFVCKDATTNSAVWLPVLLKVAQDSAPQLGGNLDVNGKTITSSSNGNVCLAPNGTGNVGVGTTNPTYSLDAVKTVDTSYVARILNTSLNANGGGLLIDTSQNTYHALTVKSQGATRFEVSDSGISLPGSNVTLETGKSVRYDVNHCYIPWDGSTGTGKLLIGSDYFVIQSGVFTSPVTVVTVHGPSGKVGIGTSSPNAVLDVTSTTSGFLPPRMTTTQRDAISSPAEGLLIYNLTTHKLNVYAGSAWEAVTSA